MVGKVDHQRVVQMTACLECLHDPADTGIQKACQSEIAGERSMAAFCREVAVVVEEIREVPDLGVGRHVLNRKVEIAVGIEVEIICRRCERIMGADKGDKGRPGFICILPCPDPRRRRVRDGAVIGRVAAFAATAVCRQFGSDVVGWRVLTQQADGPANPTDNMHRQNFL